LIEIEDTQVMDVEVKIKTLFNIKTVSSSMFLQSEELTERTTIIRTKAGRKILGTRLRRAVQKSLSRIPRLLKAQDFLLSIPSLQTNRQNDQEN
jgi:hypothetical protein